MASEQVNLTVVRSPIAIDELDQIWRWNADRYGESHATEYLHFLNRAVENLSANHGKGKPVPSRLGVRYILVRRRRRGHGHVVVYRVGEKAVTVAHVFHTAQDWQKKV